MLNRQEGNNKQKLKGEPQHGRGNISLSRIIMYLMTKGSDKKLSDFLSFSLSHLIYKFTKSVGGSVIGRFACIFYSRTDIAYN